jgi:hypothetical protein
MTTSDALQTADQLEQELQSLELVKELRGKVDTSDLQGWYETRKFLIARSYFVFPQGPQN